MANPQSSRRISPMGALATKKITSAGFKSDLDKTLAKKAEDDPNAWETVEDTSQTIKVADDPNWETVEEKPAEQPKYEEKPGFFSKALDFATTPLSGDKFQQMGKAAGDFMVPEGEGRFKATGKGDLEDWLAWTEATGRGLHRGIYEGAGAAMDQFTSPADLASTAMGAGAFSAAGRGMKTAANALRQGTRLASLPIVGHGLKGIKEAGGDIFSEGLGAENATRLAGSVVEAGAGAAGVHFPKSALDQPVKKAALAVGDIIEIMGKKHEYLGIGKTGKPRTKILADQSVPVGKPAPVQEPGDIPLTKIPEEQTDIPLNDLLKHETAGDIPLHELVPEAKPAIAEPAVAARTADSGRLDALYEKIDANTASSAEIDEAAKLLDAKLDAEQAAGIKPEVQKETAATTENDKLRKRRSGFKLNPKNMSGPQLGKKVMDFMSEDKGELDVDAFSKYFQGEEDLGYSNRTNHPDTVSLGELPRGEIDLNQAAIDAGSDLARSLTPSRKRPNFNQRALGTQLDETAGKIQLPPEFATAENFNPEYVPQTERPMRSVRDGLPPEFAPDTRQVDEFMPEMGSEGYSPRFEPLRSGQAITPEQAQSPSMMEKIRNFMRDEDGSVNFGDEDPKQPLRSEFAYDWPDFHESGQSERQYNLFGGESHQSTVGAGELEARGYPRPGSEPEFGENVKRYDKKPEMKFERYDQEGFDQRRQAMIDDTDRMRQERLNAPFDQKDADFRADWDRRQRNSALSEGRNINDIHTPLTREQEIISASNKKIRDTQDEYSSWFSEQEELLPEGEYFKPPSEIESAHRAKIEQMQDEHEALVKKLTGGPEAGRLPDIDVQPEKRSFGSRLLESAKDEQGSVPRKPKETPEGSAKESANSEALFGRGNLDDLTKELVVMGRRSAKDLEYQRLIPENMRFPLKEGETWRSRTRQLIDAKRENQAQSQISLGQDKSQGFDPNAFSAAKNDPAVIEAVDTIRVLEDELQKTQGLDPKRTQQITAEIERQETVIAKTISKIKNFMNDEAGEIRFDSPNAKEKSAGRRIGLLDDTQLKEGLPIKGRTAPEPPPESAARQIWNSSMSTMSVDLPFMTSAAFRQASPLAWTENWFKAWSKSAKAFGSQEASDLIDAEIKNSKYFKPRYKPLVDKDGNIKSYKELPSVAESAGVKMTDYKHISSREESIRGSLAEKIPVYGKYVKASNRGYSTFLNSLRKSQFENMMETGEFFGSAAEDLIKAKEIAEFVNAATGRASLTADLPGGYQLSVEQAADKLALGIWSPRLIASRLKFLNPMTYANATPQVRAEYLKGLARSVGTWWGMAGLAKMAGAEVSVDPTNADFGKIKIGDTRLDAGAGFQQLLVFGARMMPENDYVGGHFTSSVTGKSSQYGKGFKPRTRASTISDFAASKMHPSAKLALDLLSVSKDRPVHLGDRAVQMVLPMMAQDIMEAMKENPEMAIAMAPLSSMGFGTSTYNKGSFNDPVFTDSIENAMGMEPRSLSGTVKRW